MIKKQSRLSAGQSNRQGFSLVEVLFSVFLVSIGLLASLQLLSKGLTESLDSRDQSIASGLAQEGIELVRNVRDNNWATADAGKSFAHFVLGGDCRIDKSYAYPASIDCTAGVPAKRLYIDSTGFYGHSSVNSTATKFYRKLIISGATDRTVISMVAWNGSFPASNADCNTKNKCVYTETTLSSWGE
ncbi:MAG: prepilin-type N-terminal cleavage/methylation domain-containing protein [Candidatus Moranbacteria bacterium]|nr:prepilin-type N-terminal cleavage/methylation domain-containing protein [Candidatus Moranbacteria bacterium]